MSDALDGKAIRAIRDSLGMTETEFALLFGVTIRTVGLWESDVVVPSRLTAMVIRAAAERARAAREPSDRGDARRSTSDRGDSPRPRPRPRRRA